MDKLFRPIQIYDYFLIRPFCISTGDKKYHALILHDEVECDINLARELKKQLTADSYNIMLSGDIPAGHGNYIFLLKYLTFIKGGSGRDLIDIWFEYIGTYVLNLTQLYVIEFVSMFRHVCGFTLVLFFPLQIQLSATT